MTLENFKPINNLVLIKTIEDGTMRGYGASGIILGVPGAAKDQYLKNYSHRRFEVVKTPEKLVFPSNKKEYSDTGYAFRYRTDMELKSGDIVWVKLRSGHGALGIDIDGERYHLIHYSDCFVAQRRSERKEWNKLTRNIIIKDDICWDVIPLNGNIVCEKLYEKPLLKLDIKDRREIPGRLMVKYIGQPSVSYFTIVNNVFMEIELPDVTVKHKDIIQLDGPYLNIEGEYFHDFNGTTQPVVVHRTNIAATLS